jgi:DNA repair exonuclease SbcCD ATPase subunit
MRTREKVAVFVVIATLVLGALIFIAFRENEVEANHFRWLLGNQIKYGLSSPAKFLDELPAGSLVYAGLTIFAVFMVIIILKMVRDGEIQALRRHLLNLRAEKVQTDSLLQEEVWKGKHERQAKDSVRKDLDTSIEKIELLIGELNEKERLLKARETELMTAKSSSVEFADSGSSRNPTEGLLRDELKKKNVNLQSKDSIIKELENRLSAKIRLWESQLLEKEGLLKGREQEVDGLRSEIVELGERLTEMEAAKKRADGLLQEELRQKKEVLEANDLATRTEEKRLSERIRALENQVGEKERVLRTRDTELNGFGRQLADLESAKELMESRLQEEIGKLDQDRRAKENIIVDLEQRLGTSIHALRTEVGEKDLLLQARDGELKSLNSEVKAISLRLSEMAAAKVRAEETLQEVLRKEKQQREADRADFRERQEHQDKEINLLATQVKERDEFLKNRAGEIRALKQDVRTVTLRLEEINAAKERNEALLQKGLQEEKQQREAKELAGRELEERYGKQVQSLTTQLSEKDAFLARRDDEIKSLEIQVNSLAEQINKVGSAKEQAASLLQQKLRKEKEVLQASDSAIKEIEESFQARIRSLEDQLSAKQELVGGRDREVAALTSEVASLNQRVTELSAASEHAESLFQEAVKERADLLQSKDAGIKRVEEDLAEKLRRLESQLREKEELLHSRETQIDAFKNQLDDLASSKEHAARTLQDDLRQKTELLDEKAAAMAALEERFSTRIHTLESALIEKQEIVEAREAQLKELASKANTLSGEMVELETSKDHATRMLHEDLRQKTELLQSKESSMKALEERLTGKIRSLDNQVSQKQELLIARDTELDALMAKVSELTQKVSELGAERERSDRLIQEELREKTAMLQSKESSIAELEERLKGRVDSLERQVADKQKLLEASGVDLSDLRAQVSSVTERLNETEAAKVYLEGLLQKERHNADQMSVSVEPSQREASDGMNGESHGLDTLLNERETLLKARDKLIQDLMSELKEKKTQLARQEIDVWQKIERRDAWKHRLSKIGIRIKN